jgi:hypothetical protein
MSSAPEAEYAAALADAQAHLDEHARNRRPPLLPLPAGYVDGLGALHAVAEETLQTKRRSETGSGWLRPFTPGGVGTPGWERGRVSGLPGSARVLGSELVILEGDEERRTPVLTDAAVTAAVSDFDALALVALAMLVDLAGPGANADPIRLWPEHFDVATVLGDEDAGTRANFGGSPGDATHPEPYLYVGPWSEPADAGNPFWNAEGFTGAELGYAELLAAGDQLQEARLFLERGWELLQESTA